MLPRESGGNVRRKVTHQKTGPVSIPRPEVSVRARPPVSPAHAPAAPMTYRPRYDPSPFGLVVGAAHRVAVPKRGDRKAEKKAGKEYQRTAMARKQFPYTNALQVAFANAAGDIERNILPKAVRPPTAPPKVRPGVKPGDAGYAYRGHNEFWLTPAAYLNNPNFTRGVALHELAHTRQPTTPLPKWVIEGGADFVAKHLAKQIGLPSYRPGYPKYLKSVERRVKRRK